MEGPSSKRKSRLSTPRPSEEDLTNNRRESRTWTRGRNKFGDGDSVAFDKGSNKIEIDSNASKGEVEVLGSKGEPQTTRASTRLQKSIGKKDMTNKIDTTRGICDGDNSRLDSPSKLNLELNKGTVTPRKKQTTLESTVQPQRPSSSSDSSVSAKGIEKGNSQQTQIAATEKINRQSNKDKDQLENHVFPKDLTVIRYISDQISDSNGKDGQIQNQFPLGGSTPNVIRKTKLLARYKCAQCGIQFQNLLELASHKPPKTRCAKNGRHEKPDSDNKGQTGQIHKHFPQLGGGNIPIQSRKTKSLAKCTQCGRQFSNLLGLFSHKRFKTRCANKNGQEKPDLNMAKFVGVCDQCKKKFSSARGLAIHKNRCGKSTHKIQEKPEIFSVGNLFSCQQCPKKFRKMLALQSHEVNYHSQAKVKIYECIPCSKQFINITALIIHVGSAVHNNSQKSELSSEIEIPESPGKSPYDCKECPKQFSRLSALFSHKRFHVAETNKPFSCRPCKKKFANIIRLRSHAKTETHEDKISYFDKSGGVVLGTPIKTKSIEENSENVLLGHRCKCCSKQFPSIRGLRTHESYIRKGERQVVRSGAVPSKSEVESDSLSLTPRKSSEIVLSDTVTVVHSPRRVTRSYPDKEIHSDATNLEAFVGSSLEGTKGEPGLRTPRKNMVILPSSPLKPVSPQPQPSSAPADNPINSFPCNICSKLFTKNQLKIHKRVVHRFDSTKKQKVQSQKTSKSKNVGLSNGNRPIKSGSALGSRRQDSSRGRSLANSVQQVCKYCLIVLPDMDSRIVHQRTHTGENPYQCSKCLAQFPNSIELKEHIQNCQTSIPGEVEKVSSPDPVETVAPETNVLSSPSPSKPSRTSPRKAVIVEVETSTKPETNEKFVCKFCSKEFKRKARLNFHLRMTHSGERPYICKDCKEGFPFKSTLTAHEVTHKTDRPFECVVCRSRFRRKYHLQVHSRIHLNLMPFQCRKCGRMFRQMANYQSHLNRPNTCKNWILQKKTLQKKTLQKINGKAKLKRKNETSSLLKSKMKLGKIFSRLVKNVLYSKVARVCLGCKTGFSSLSAMTTHVQVHNEKEPFRCIPCRRNFPKTTDLNSHLDSKHGFKYLFSCNDCGRRCKTSQVLGRHLLIHTNERPFKCDECKKSYSQKTTLIHHMKSHDLKKNLGEPEGQATIRVKDKVQKRSPRKHSKLDGRVVPDSTGEENQEKILNLVPDVEVMPGTSKVSDDLVPVPAPVLVVESDEVVGMDVEIGENHSEVGDILKSTEIGNVDKCHEKSVDILEQMELEVVQSENPTEGVDILEGTELGSVEDGNRDQGGRVGILENALPSLQSHCEVHADVELIVPPLEISNSIAVPIPNVVVIEIGEPKPYPENRSQSPVSIFKVEETLEQLKAKKEKKLLNEWNSFLRVLKRNLSK